MIKDTELAYRVFEIVFHSEKPIKAHEILKILNFPEVQKKDVNRVLYKMTGAVISPAPGFWICPHKNTSTQN